MSVACVSYRPLQAIGLSTVWLRHWSSSNGVRIADFMTSIGLGSSVSLPVGLSFTRWTNGSVWECCFWVRTMCDPV